MGKEPKQQGKTPSLSRTRFPKTKPNGNMKFKFSPLSKRGARITTTANALKSRQRSNPCICGCKLDCTANYVVPFKPNTNGRVRMLKLFGLKIKLQPESYSRLLSSKQPRLSLFHFTPKQLQAATRGRSAGKAFTKLLPPHCWDEKLLVKTPELQQTVADVSSTTSVPSGSPTLNTRSLTNQDESLDQPQLSPDEEIKLLRRLLAKRTAEAEEWKQRYNESSVREEQVC